MTYLDLSRTAATGEDGAFELDGLPSGEFELALKPGSGSPYPDALFGPFTVQSGETKELALELEAVRVNDSQISEVSFEEPSLVRVEGRVTSGGQPVAGATIAAMDPWRDEYPWWDLTLAVAKTDENGRYQLALKGNRRYFLQIRETDERGQAQVELELPTSSEAFRFDISLPAGRLHGVVVKAGTAIPVADALVELFDSGKKRIWCGRG